MTEADTTPTLSVAELDIICTALAHYARTGDGMGELEIEEVLALRARLVEEGL